MATVTFGTYPYTTTIQPGDTYYIQHESDGFKLTIPNGMFSSAAQITISREARSFFLYSGTSAYGRAVCLRYCYGVQQNSGPNANARSQWSVALKYEASYDPCKTFSSFNGYKDVNGVISDFDPGAWQPAPTKGANSNYIQTGTYTGNYFRNGANFFLICVDWDPRR